jgi:hypothetical protein
MLSVFYLQFYHLEHLHYLQKECWRPRGVRGRVEDLSAAHPTD